MGKVLSIMLRQSRRVFAQERAERIISKPKPKMHPYYPTEEKTMKQLKGGYPELAEMIKEHHPQLDERVHAIRITSKEIAQLDGGVPKPTRPMIEGGEKKEGNLLPQDRFTYPEPEFGFYEPSENKVPRGRILFSKAMELMRLREESQEKAQTLGQQYGLQENDLKSILQYFAPFMKAVDLPPLEKSDMDKVLDPDTREAIGRRAILQKHRQISDLELQRINAKAVAKQSEPSTQLNESNEDDDIKDRRK